MPFNVLETITEEERLNFSQSFDVKRPGILGTIFPDTKTQYLKAEYYRLMAGQRLPEVAFVHALDTEAEIGSRPGFEKVLTEKLFIKRKINQSERLQQAIENGVPDDNNLKKFVFDDAANLFEGVVARANVMKGQFLSTGIVKIKENHVDMSIDYGVPSSAPSGDAYARLIDDCIQGDPTLFTRSDAVEASWNFFDPVLRYWKDNPDAPLYGYPAGTWGPLESEAMMHEHGADWTNPCKNLTNTDQYCEL